MSYEIIEHSARWNHKSFLRYTRQILSDHATILVFVKLLFEYFLM